MRVHLASVSHRHGTNVYAGGSWQELIEKLARYCRDGDERRLLVGFSGSEEELVDAYFLEENYGSQEFLTTEHSPDEVLADVTTLVRLLADTWQVDHVNGGMDDLHEKAQRLTGENYEGAARAAGWMNCPMGGKGFYRTSADRDEMSACWEELCGAHDIEPLPRATNFYSISEELADTLAKDERVMRDFAGMTIWARVEG